MNIQPTGMNLSIQNQPNFKSCYPVVHWLAETNGSYAPVRTMELTRRLQSALVRVLNKSVFSVTGDKAALCERIQKIISKGDLSYYNKPIVRSFYDNGGGFTVRDFKPFSYMITGEDVYKFEEQYGHPIGAEKSKSVFTEKGLCSAELKMALGDYFRGGRNFVRNGAMNFCDNNKVPYALHTKFEILRARTGRVKGFLLKDVRFLPIKGADNPLKKLGYQV